MSDIEKNETNSLTSDTQGEQIPTKTSFIHKFIALLNAESKGIERITEDERDPNDGAINAASMWFSANMCNSAMALGMLGGGTFGLSFWESVLTIIFFNILGLAGVAFFSTFGPEFGLRQMIISRYLCGNYAMRVFAFITLIACVGWSAVNTMVSAQLLNMVNTPHNLPPAVGCIILVIIVIIVSMFGYKVVHTYEKYSWIPSFAVFLVMIARVKMSNNFDPGHFHSGEATAAGVLSFGGAIFGFATGWTSYASDYTVFIRQGYPKWKLFVAVAVGLFIPLNFTMILGAAAITGINKDDTWLYYYQNYSTGGLMFAILSVNSLGGFGQFCSVILALSSVANAVPNMYTMAFCAQAIYSKFQKLPRAFWSIIGNFMTLAIAIPAYYKFADFMENFMNLIGYYLAIYQSIGLSEHFIYRKGFKGYDVSGWDDPSTYPIGIAGLVAFAFGVFGAVMGMSQTWYTGKIGILINENGVVPGADIGFELAFGFSFIAYNVIRPFEIKYTGR